MRCNLEDWEHRLQDKDVVIQSLKKKIGLLSKYLSSASEQRKVDERQCEKLAGAAGYVILEYTTRLWNVWLFVEDLETKLNDMTGALVVR